MQSMQNHKIINNSAYLKCSFPNNGAVNLCKTEVSIYLSHSHFIADPSSFKWKQDE